MRKKRETVKHKLFRVVNIINHKTAEGIADEFEHMGISEGIIREYSDTNKIFAKEWQVVSIGYRYYDRPDDLYENRLKTLTKLEQINEDARKHDMSYGYYVSLYKL